MSSVIQLRPYQQKAKTETREHYIKSGRSVLICSPTGSGKTIIFCSSIQDAIKRGTKCMVLTDRLELLTSAKGTLSKLGIEAEVINSKSKYVDPAAQVFVGMAQTLKRRVGDEFYIKLCESIKFQVNDEAHKTEFDFFFERNIFPNARVMGLSATPKRKGKQRQLKTDYEKMITTLSVPDLIEMGHLVDARIFVDAGSKISLENVSVKRGDYVESEMFGEFNKNEVYEGVVRNWKQHALDTITLVFCVNIEHCILTAKQFNASGVKAKFITSTTPDEYLEDYYDLSGPRDQILSEWMNGDFPVLVNASIFTTGFDHPPLETIVLNRATTSENLYLQMIGRGSRPFPGKTHFNLLDFGQNVKRFGEYNMVREYSLEHSTRDRQGEAPMKECPESKGGCGCFIHTSLKFCDYCNFEFITVDGEPVEVDLIEYTKDKMSYKDAESIAETADIEKLEDIRSARGYNIGWVVRKIKAIAEEAQIEIKLNEYAKLKGYKTGWVGHQMEML